MHIFRTARIGSKALKLQEIQEAERRMMEAIRDINQQESEEKLRHCCRYKPEIFRDTKTEQIHPQEMWVVACPSCGKFVDHLERDSAIYKWNEFPEEAERNPKDLEFIKKLENAKRGLE